MVNKDGIHKVVITDLFMFECDIIQKEIDLVADFCLTKQIYSELLNAFEFKEITEVQIDLLKMLLEDGKTRTRRYKTFECSEMLLEDCKAERQPRGCKYPTPRCSTTVRA